MLASLKLSDKEAEEIRDITSMLADVLFDDWNEKRMNSLATKIMKNERNSIEVRGDGILNNSHPRQEQEAACRLEAVSD